MNNVKNIWQRANRDKDRAYTAAYRATDKGKKTGYAYRTADKDKEYRKDYRAKHRVNFKAYRKKYLQSPKGKAASTAISAKRRAAQLPRIPLWGDIEAVKQVYVTCPEGYHVDHIIPLQGELVSGLHIAANLQYLTAKANCEKNNSYDVNQYEYRRRRLA